MTDQAEPDPGGSPPPRRGASLESSRGGEVLATPQVRRPGPGPGRESGDGAIRLGLTYDLRDDYLRRGFDPEEVAEFDKQQTIDALEEVFRGLGYETDRIGGLQDLVERLQRGSRWDLVFNIAEGLYGYAREAQVPALLDAYRIPYVFSDPLTLALTLHKGYAKRIARDLGVPTADFAIVERPEDAERVSLPLPLFAKPVAEGSSKGITRRSVIERREDIPAVCAALLRRHRQPVLLERFLPGREFTVAVLGTGAEAAVLGVLEITVHPEVAASYSLAVKSAVDYQRIIDYRVCPEPELARECEQVALGAWRGLGCRDAGRVDLRCDDAGQPRFLEVNPLAGLNPRDSDLTILTGLLGLSYEEVIGRILAAAHARTGVPMPAVAGSRAR